MADVPGCDTHAMVLVHRVFRREFRMLPRLVGAVADGDTARATVVATHASELIDVLHHHHAAEDELIWPVLRTEPELDPHAVERMQAQHDRLAEILGRVERLLAKWRGLADDVLRDSLAGQLELLYVALDEHLDDEEAHVLPMVERTLTRRQWKAVGATAMAAMPRRRLVVFLGHILEDADPQEGAAFLRNVPMPGRIGYRVIGRRTYHREVSTLRDELIH